MNLRRNRRRRALGIARRSEWDLVVWVHIRRESVLSGKIRLLSMMWWISLLRRVCLLSRYRLVRIRIRHGSTLAIRQSLLYPTAVGYAHPRLLLLHMWWWMSMMRHMRTRLVVLWRSLTVVSWLMARCRCRCRFLRFASCEFVRGFDGNEATTYISS